MAFQSRNRFKHDEDILFDASPVGDDHQDVTPGSGEVAITIDNCKGFFTREDCDVTIKYKDPNGTTKTITDIPCFKGVPFYWSGVTAYDDGTTQATSTVTFIS